MLLTTSQVGPLGGCSLPDGPFRHHSGKKTKSIMKYGGKSRRSRSTLPSPVLPEPLQSRENALNSNPPCVAVFPINCRDDHAQWASTRPQPGTHHQVARSGPPMPMVGTRSNCICVISLLRTHVRAQCRSNFACRCTRVLNLVRQSNFSTE